MRHSADEGRCWASPVLIASEADCWLTNAFPISLLSGKLLVFWNERPLDALRYQHDPAPPGALTRPIQIRMALSEDQGLTWSAPRALYTAGPSYQDGCWEPAAIQLAGGEVQVYFANELPYQETAEQEISLISSADEGATWSPSRPIAMRRGRRDGMPAPLILDEDSGIIVAIEDNGLAGDSFKPAIVYTAASDSWKSGVVGDNSRKRWSALAEPLAASWYGGAPFLAKLPSGETLLSYQESEDGSLANCRMAVCIGDRNGRNFAAKTYPFARLATPGQKWNSLFVKNDGTVMAVSGAVINGVRGIWTIDGVLAKND